MFFIFYVFVFFIFFSICFAVFNFFFDFIKSRFTSIMQKIEGVISNKELSRVLISYCV